MLVRRLTALVLMGLIVTAALAQTGTPRSVLVEDAEGDAPFEEADVLGLSVNDTGTHLNVTLLLNTTAISPGYLACLPQDLGCTDTGPELRLHVRFRLSDADNRTLAPPNSTAGTYHLLAGVHDIGIGWGFHLLYENATGNVTYNDTLQGGPTNTSLTWAVPLGTEAFPVPAADRTAPFRISEVWAASDAFVCLSEAGCAGVGEPDDLANGTVHPLDRAPDNGTGDAYTFAYTPPPEPTPTATPTADPAPGPEPDPGPTFPPEPDLPRTPYRGGDPPSETGPDGTQGVPGPAVLGVVGMLAALVAWRRRHA